MMNKTSHLILEVTFLFGVILLILNVIDKQLISFSLAIYSNSCDVLVAS